MPLKTQCFNPYLPSWEYIPDGEPYVFGDRVYVFGSHDKFNGWVFCLNDYVSWSAPVDDLSDWRCEGTIYNKTDDPLNRDGRMCLYAPDVTIGQDGRYYLYYVLDKVSIVSVAVCDTPAGKYEFYGYVHYPDGTRLGEREGDEPQFDPAALTEGEVTYLYTGFCGHDDKSRTGAMATVLECDMLTIKEEPVFVAPGIFHGEGTSFKGHEFFEASSIRKHGDTYYFIYSSVMMNELCYATSKHPTKDYIYGGVVVSNCDLHIDSYKPANLRAYPDGNNHGSIVKINRQWYVFYHRQTNGTWFSRQACMERIDMQEDGTIIQVEMTSLGGSDKPLSGCGEYPAYIACNLFRTDGDRERIPQITQDGRDGDEEQGFISHISDSTVMGFKYFKCKAVKKVYIKTRGYCDGVFELRTSLEGKPLGSIRVENVNIWTEFFANISIPDGIHALFFTYKGNGAPSLASFTLETEENNVRLPRGFDEVHKDIEYGKLMSVNYDSQTTGSMRKCYVFTPPGYDPARVYPVLYLLHGIGGTHKEWLHGSPNEILSNLMAEGKTPPMIAVMPNVRAMEKDEVPSEVFAQENIEAFDNFIFDLRDDLMPFIAKKYSVSRKREDQAIAGLSMGGREALYIGVSMADSFRYIGAFSPAPGLLPFSELNYPGQLTAKELTIPDEYKEDTFLFICNGNQDDVVNNIPFEYHKVFQDNQIEHEYHTIDGGHDFSIWKNGLYHFASSIFQSKVN